MKNIPWRIIGVITSWKVAILFVTFAAGILLPFNKNLFYSNFMYPTDQKISYITPFTTWDAQHYLYLSDNGYKKDQPSNWFYPFFPYSVKIVKLLFQNTFISALLVSNLYSLIALLFFYFLVKDLFSEKIAFYSVIAFISFPSAFYLNLIYSESSFIFLSIGFFYFLYKGKTLYSLPFIFLLPLARSIGILIAIPYFIFLLQKKEGIKRITIPTFNKPIKIKLNPAFFLVTIPLLGYLMNFLLMYILTGDPFSQFVTLRYFIGRFSIFNVFNIELFFQNLFGTPLALHGFTNSLLDRLFFAFFLVMAPFVYKKTNKVFFFYYLALGMVPLLGSFMGYMRYLLPAFPLFITLGSVFAKNKVLLYAYLYLSISLQIMLVIMSALSYWVA